jgi:hypothetical protein
MPPLGYVENFIFFPVENSVISIDLVTSKPVAIYSISFNYLVTNIFLDFVLIAVANAKI